MLAGIFWNMQNPDLGEHSSELRGGEIYIPILTDFKSRYRNAFKKKKKASSWSEL